MNAALLRLDNVSVSFAGVPVLARIDLAVMHGEFVAVVGASGCGKTTLLNVCSGWLKPTAGRVRRPPDLRTVFQHDGLFPWYTVDENILLGLADVHDLREKRLRADALLELIGLSACRGMYPHQLSGGMRQRVELARALAGDTPLLLMDEPCSALDYLARLKMRRDLARIFAEEQRAVLFVTHDIEEAIQLADRVLVSSDKPGRVKHEVRLATPRPRDPKDEEVMAAVRHILRCIAIQSDCASENTQS